MGAGRGRLAGDVRRMVHGGRMPRATCRPVTRGIWHWVHPEARKLLANNAHRNIPVPTTASTMPSVLA